MLIAVGRLTAARKLLFAIAANAIVLSRLTLNLRHWPRLDLGVTCPSVQLIRGGLRSRPDTVRSQSGCPTGRPLMCLLNRLRGRLWRSVYAASVSPASGGPAATGSHPGSSESQKRIRASQRPPFGAAFAFCGASGVMGEKLAPTPRSCPRRRISNLNVHSESVRGAHEARLSSCRVLSHDAAGFVCRRARRAASPRLGRAGADPGDSACRRDFPGAVSQSGEPGRRDDIARAARIDPGESTCRDDCFSAVVQSGESAGADSRPREPVHATCRRRRRRRELIRRPALPPSARRPPPRRSRPGRGAAEAEESRAASAAARDRAQRRSPTRRFSPTPSSPPPRRPSAIRRSWTPAAGRPTSPRSAPERRARRS